MPNVEFCELKETLYETILSQAKTMSIIRDTKWKK